MEYVVPTYNHFLLFYTQTWLSI